MEWNDVKNGLPKDSCIVIVSHSSIKKNKVTHTAETAIFNAKTNKFHLSTSVNTLSGTLQIELKDITHWLLMPTPPMP